MSRYVDVDMAGIRRADHYRIRRRARLAAGARLLYARVGPKRGFSPQAWGATPWGAGYPTRWEDPHAEFPEGYLVLHSPEIPTFRAVVGYRVSPGARRRPGALHVDVQTWSNRIFNGGPNYFNDRSPRRSLRRELRAVEWLLRGSV